VKKIAAVIFCIFIGVMLSAVSLCLSQPAPKARLQIVGSQYHFHQVLEPELPPMPIKQASLTDLPKSIQSIEISDGTPPGRYWIPRSQKYVISQVLAWLKMAAPDTEKTPPWPTLVMIDYLGPSQLYLTTPDNRRLSIYPAYYYTESVDEQSGWTMVQVHYVPDIVVLYENEKYASYFKSEQLYGWLKENQWKAEFTAE
jgi:hypothetical protein